jgi:hypothetical protein
MFTRLPPRSYELRQDPLKDAGHIAFVAGARPVRLV